MTAMRRTSFLVSGAVLAALLAVLPAVVGAQAIDQPAAPLAPPAEPAAKDFSTAERLLLMSPQFGLVKAPATLQYRFRKSGSLEEGFEDRVSIRLQRPAAGNACCTASGEFLSGARRVSLPDIEQAEGNPVTLYFLEHDIRDMKARTKGSITYFRKRIRMALYQSASVRDVTVTYRGRAVAAREIRIEPYLDDPNRAKFERFVRKQYTFVLSDAVAGAVVSIRSVVPAEAGEKGAAAPLIEEELLIDGAAAATRVTSALR
ncbi:hypothetical protein [Sphaerotilus microaerophilus]|uniref:Outer membrane lipoprotein-sorting protein n=1 Tax=Sphaerotilus microaerophilus TaxID=2914710 RepID=A0ABN6PN44_9BURK|nr:hypothetical protein [Sphaerotilus sp. FB-5]BDI06631.1 hypothetical protein CATMQ487_36010 [Sphaerotilus sp. FB-5]